MLSQCVTSKPRRLFGKPLLQALLPLAERRGVHQRELFKGTPLNHSQLIGENYRITETDLLTIIANAHLKIRDPQLWQLTMESVIQQRLTPLIDLCLHAPNVKLAMALLRKYHPILLPRLLLFPRLSQDTMSIDVITTSGLSSKQDSAAQQALNQMALALLLSLAKKWQVPLQQWRLWLPAECSAIPSWQDWVGHIHQRPITAVQLPTSILTTPLNRDTNRYLQAQSFCQMQLDVLADEPVLFLVFRWLYRRLHNHQPVSLELLAGALAISVSSCKRLLGAHGRSFQQLHDQVRLYKLLKLLESHPYSNNELAEKLGYSNSNNFRRACKRWLGMAPDLLRQNSNVLINASLSLPH